MTDANFTICLATESGRLEMAKQLFDRFCIDLQYEDGKAKTRLIAGIQIALRDAAEGKMSDPVLYYTASDQKDARTNKGSAGKE